MRLLSDILQSTLKCTVMVLLILALIQPFGIDNLKEGRIGFILAETLLAFISVFASSAVATLVVAKGKRNQLATRQFLLCLIIGNAINIPLLGTLLLCYNGWFHSGDPFVFFFPSGHFSLMPVVEMSAYVAIISVFIVLYEYYTYRNSQLTRELEEVKSINELLERRQSLMEAQQEDSTNEAEQLPPTLITITGQGQNSVLEVDPEKIIYVESMANYAVVCYIADNETKTATLRITLKQIRETLDEVDCIVQCHRAFLVNINFVVSMTTRNSSYQLNIFGMEKQIPVSRANTEAIKKKLGA